MATDVSWKDYLSESLLGRLFLCLRLNVYRDICSSPKGTWMEMRRLKQMIAAKKKSESSWFNHCVYFFLQPTCTHTLTHTVPVSHIMRKKCRHWFKLLPSSLKRLHTHIGSTNSSIPACLQYPNFRFKAIAGDHLCRAVSMDRLIRVCHRTLQLQ